MQVPFEKLVQILTLAALAVDGIDDRDGDRHAVSAMLLASVTSEEWALLEHGSSNISTFALRRGRPVLRRISPQTNYGRARWSMVSELLTKILIT
jgi:hypothetical protein